MALGGIDFDDILLVGLVALLGTGAFMFGVDAWRHWVGRTPHQKSSAALSRSPAGALVHCKLLVSDRPAPGGQSERGPDWRPLEGFSMVKTMVGTWSTIGLRAPLAETSEQSEYG